MFVNLLVKKEKVYDLNVMFYGNCFIGNVVVIDKIS